MSTKKNRNEIRDFIKQVIREEITNTPMGQLGEDESTELPPTTSVPSIGEVARTDQAPRPPGGGSGIQPKRSRRPVRRKVRELANKLKERIMFDEGTGKWVQRNEDMLREKEVPIQSDEPGFIQ